jgi:hypothetical protein
MKSTEARTLYAAEIEKRAALVAQHSDAVALREQVFSADAASNRRGAGRLHAEAEAMLAGTVVTEEALPTLAEARHECAVLEEAIELQNKAVEAARVAMAREICQAAAPEDRKYVTEIEKHASALLKTLADRRAFRERLEIACDGPIFESPGGVREINLNPRIEWALRGDLQILSSAITDFGYRSRS